MMESILHMAIAEEIFVFGADEKDYSGKLEGTQPLFLRILFLLFQRWLFAGIQEQSNFMTLAIQEVPLQIWTYSVVAFGVARYVHGAILSSNPRMSTNGFGARQSPEFEFEIENV
jgi:hypothetical protein